MNDTNTINGYPASEYQIAIRDFVKDGSGHAVVSATAGSGKTSSLEWCMRFVPGQSVLYLAFNRDIVGAFKKRQNGQLKNVKASTMHGWGLENLRRANSRLQVDTDSVKVWKIAQTLLPGLGSRRTPIQSSLVELLRMVRLTLTDPNDDQALDRMCEQFHYEFDDLTDDDITRLYDLLPKALTQSCELFWNAGQCDFEDMLYMAGLPEIGIEPYDFIFYDELQDANAAQLRLLQKSIGNNGRAVCVGDRYQSLYSFAGSFSGAMDEVKSALNAVELPLSISYRCPRKVVEEAKKLCPLIEASPFAKDGEVLHIPPANLDTKIRPELDIILCRHNAPLVGKALDFIANGKKACMRGRDIGKNLAGFAKKIAGDSRTILEFHEHLDAWEDAEIGRLLAKFASEQRLDLVHDKAGVIRQVASRVNSPNQIAVEIEKIFRDQPEGIQLSSVHRAKGLEFEQVFILQPELMLKKIRSTNEDNEERNVKFVAITRSKDSLYFLDGEQKSDKPLQSKSFENPIENTVNEILTQSNDDLRSLIDQAKTMCLSGKLPKSDKIVIRKGSKLIHILNKATELCNKDTS